MGTGHHDWPGDEGTVPRDVPPSATDRFVPMPIGPPRHEGEPMSANVILDPAAELERATSDYLAVSRNSHLYGTTAEYELAERKAWDRMTEAAAAVQAASAG
jgi:hypothetical protein